MNRALIIAALLLIGGISLRVFRREAAAPARVEAESKAAEPEGFALEPESPRLRHAPPSITPAGPPTVRTQKLVAAVTAAKTGKPPIQDLLARLALAEVGFDADAEAYWLTAINDPTLGPTERQDLIEDLNEDGFEDPENLSAEDIPLILSRIDLIETHAPLAMDQVNADAFAEAYKDLWNMLDKATAAVIEEP